MRTCHRSPPSDSEARSTRPSLRGTLAQLPASLSTHRNFGLPTSGGLNLHERSRNRRWPLKEDMSHGNSLFLHQADIAVHALIASLLLMSTSVNLLDSASAAAPLMPGNEHTQDGQELKAARHAVRNPPPNQGVAEHTCRRWGVSSCAPCQGSSRRMGNAGGKGRKSSAPRWTDL